MFLLLILNFLMFFHSFINAWQSSVQFDFVINHIDEYLPIEEIRIFEGIYENRDYFALLSNVRNNYIYNLNISDSIFIGARNHLYELSVPELNLLNSLKWSSTQYDTMQCLNRSIILNKEECDNYIKLFLKTDDETFKICATNSLNPKCRFYNLKNNSALDTSLLYNETSGIGYSPLRAYENKYVYNYLETNKQLYIANTLDLNRHFTTISREFDQERVGTNINDKNWINKADFVSSFSNSDRMFFVFNEDMNPDESTSSNSDSRQTRRISRISHICLNDHGSAGLNSLRNIWTTFLKSRLSCVYDISKHKPDPSLTENSFLFDQSSNLFYFDEIKSMSELYTVKKAETNSTYTYFYALFTTSKNSISASAVCLFTMDQIMSSFNSEYQNSQGKSVPTPRPSQCPNTLTYQHIVYSRKNVAMQNEIVSEAILVESLSPNRYNSITVDYEVKNRQNDKNDVLFVGTDDGEILTFVVKTIELESNRLNAKLVYSEKILLFDTENDKVKFESIQTGFNHKKSKRDSETKKKQTINTKSIQSISLFAKSSENHEQINRKLILTTQNKVISMPAQFCSTKNSFSKCNNVLYPYCVWSSNYSICVDSNGDDNFELKFNKKLFLTDNSTNLKFNSSPLGVNRPESLGLANEQFFENQILSIKNNQITISLTLFIFLLSLFLVLFFSFLIAILLILNMVRKNNRKDKIPINSLQWDKQLMSESEKMKPSWSLFKFCKSSKNNNSSLSSECSTSQSSVSVEEKVLKRNYQIIYSNVFKKRKDFGAFTITGSNVSSLVSDKEQRYVYVDRESVLRNQIPINEYEVAPNEYLSLRTSLTNQHSISSKESNSSSISNQNSNSVTRLFANFNNARQENHFPNHTQNRFKLKYSESLNCRPKSAILPQNNFNSLRKYYI